MAVVTLIAGGNVCGRFAGCLDSIVTTDTAAGDGRVVHKSDDGPTGCYMAV